MAIASTLASLEDLGPLERNPTRTKEKFVLAGLLFSFQWDSFYWDFVLVGFRVLSTLLHNTAFLLGFMPEHFKIAHEHAPCMMIYIQHTSRKCFYARQHAVYAIVRPSVTRVDQSKTAERRIMQFHRKQ